MSADDKLEKEDCPCGCHPASESCGNCCIKSKINELWKMTASGLFELTHLIEHAETGIEKCFERIEVIEKCKIDDVPVTFSILVKRIDKLENDYVALEQFGAHRKLASIQQKRIDKLEEISNKDSIYNQSCLINLSKRIETLEKGEMSLMLDKDISRLNLALKERIEKLEKSEIYWHERQNGYITRIGILDNALHTLSEENNSLREIIKGRKCSICYGKNLCNPCNMDEK
jgi:hypothetical protein